MKLWIVSILLAALLLLGCNGGGGGGNVTQCPSNCTAGCLEDNVTCRPVQPNLCDNVTCNDKCKDDSILYTNGKCNSTTGTCTYSEDVCSFGCQNDACMAPPVCPANCPFGCDPGTSICRPMSCPTNCRYGCIPGTVQCNSEPPTTGIKNGDFEEGYMGWNTTGNAFGSAPFNGALANSQQLYRSVPYSGYSGTYFASSYLPQMDKRARGNLTSESFFISKKYLEYLVVSELSDQIYVSLIVNDTVVEETHTDNPYQPFKRVTWDVSDYEGQSGIINIVDGSNQGSIEVDDFRLVDTPSLATGQPYVNSYRNFSILPPLNWIIQEGITQGQVFIYGATESNFTTQITVTSENVDSNVTTGSYFAKGKAGLAMLLQNYSIKSESNVTIGGLDARQIEYTQLLLGNPVRSREIFIVYKNVGYTITASSADSLFDSRSSQFNESIQSFRVSQS